MIYCAYGSNLNIGQMKMRCPDAEILGTGLVFGYRLTFKGSRYNAHADIVRSRSKQGVPVVLWDISPSDERNLDRYEGYPYYYTKKIITAHVSDGYSLEAMVYVMTPGKQKGIPSENYLRIITEGYEENGLDIRYLKKCLEQSDTTV